METLLNMQALHDAYAMRQREGEIAVKPYRPAPSRGDPATFSRMEFLCAVKPLNLNSIAPYAVVTVLDG